MPIRVVETEIGVHGSERITRVYAEIYPRHVTNNARVNFPRSGDIERWYQTIRTPGDERGHLVASQFSGPPSWYNLSPQSPRVNRNAGYESITTDWFCTETEVRNFLQLSTSRNVIWIVDLVYQANSDRPVRYRLRVIFLMNDGSTHEIDTNLENPLLSQESTFWTCRNRSRRAKNANLNQNYLQCVCRITANEQKEIAFEPL